MGDMTRIDDAIAVAAAREAARQPTGQFGAQDHTAPELTLPAPTLIDQWAAEYRSAEEGVQLIRTLVERRFRDLVREQHPDAQHVTIALSYDTEGDTLVYVSEIDGDDVDDDDYLRDATNHLRAFGYTHDRLLQMNATLDEFDQFTFDLSAIEGDGPSRDEFNTKVTAAWEAWDKSATLVPGIARETGERLGVGALTFKFADTDDDRRVTLHGPDDELIEEPDLLGAMNAYVTARGDMQMFPGLEQDPDDEWTYRYTFDR